MSGEQVVLGRACHLAEEWSSGAERLLIKLSSSRILRTREEVRLRQQRLGAQSLCGAPDVREPAFAKTLHCAAPHVRQFFPCDLHAWSRRANPSHEIIHIRERHRRYVLWHGKRSDRRPLARDTIRPPPPVVPSGLKRPAGHGQQVRTCQLLCGIRGKGRILCHLNDIRAVILRRWVYEAGRVGRDRLTVGRPRRSLVRRGLGFEVSRGGREADAEQGERQAEIVRKHERRS